MSSVDDRIVNMQFNNKQFESGVSTSTKSLSSLEQSLAKTAKSPGLDGMGQSVNGVAGKFSAMQIAGVTAIATIAHKAVNAGLQMAKSFTVTPFLGGFREYEKLLTSTQTIMANTGEDVKVVGVALDNLNAYSDRTIYNFGQMADNIGKFTAAGVPLKAATISIKGLANTAALSGANVHQLNTAMYQMSQALSTGVIRLMDWNSLANAGMGGSNVREALMATTRTIEGQGAVMDGAIEKHGSFRDSLREGWLTADVFNKTMKVMAGTTNEAGESVAFSVEQLKKMGYSNKAAKKLNEISQASIESATKIKTFTQLMDVVKESIESGWAGIFKALFGDFEQATELWTGVGKTITGTLDRVFDSMSAILGSWREAGGYQDLWTGFGNIFQTVGNLLKPFVALFQAIFPATGDAGKGLASLTSGFASVTGVMERASRGAMAITPIFTVIGTGIRFLIDNIGNLIGYLGRFGSSLTPSLGSFDAFVTKITMVAEAIQSFIRGGASLSDVFGTIKGVSAGGQAIAKGIIDGIISGFDAGRIRDVVSDLGSNIIEWIKGVLGIASPAAELVPVGAAIIMGIAQGIAQSITFIFESMELIASAIMGGVKQAFGGMDALDFAALMNAVFTGGLLLTLNRVSKAMSTVLDWKKMLQDTFGQLQSTLSTFQNTLRAKALKDIAIAVGILTASLVVLSLIDPEKLAKGLGGIGAMLGLLVGTMAALSKVAKGDVGIFTLAASITMISGAMVALATAVAILGSQDVGSLAKGVGAMAAVMAIMVGSLKALSGLKPIAAGAGAAIVLMAFAMNLLAAAILAMGSMDMSTIAKGLLSMAYGLSFMVGALQALSAVKNVAKNAAAIVLMASAMLIMSAAVLAFGNMSLETLAVGFGAMAAGLLIMVGALKLLGANIAGTIAAAGAMVLMATAMAMLVPVILTLGQADLATIGTGLLALAGMMIIFVAAVAALAAVAVFAGPALLILGAALALIGVGMAAFGAGFALLAATGTAGIAVMTAAIAAFIMLLPNIAIQMAAAFVLFLETIAAAAPRVRKAMSVIFAQMLGVVQDAIPKIRKLIQTFINAAIDILGDSASKFAEKGFEVIDRFLKAAADHAPGIIDSAVKLITTFMREIGKNANKIADSAAKMLIDFINGVAKAIDDNADDLRAAGLNLARAIIDGMTGGLLSTGLSAIRNAAQRIADELPGWMKKVLGISSPSKVTHQIGYYVALGLARGIISGIRTAVSAATQMANAVIAEGNRAVLQAQLIASAAQRKADRAQAKADATRQAAFRVRRSDPALARRLKAQAEREQKIADAVQTAADKADQRVSDTRAFEEADLHGKGDIKDAQAIQLADRAEAMLARANAEAVRARQLMKTNVAAGRAMLAQARNDARLARSLAAQAQAAHAAAQRFYAQEVNERIKALEADRKADEEAAKAQAEYDAADAAGKAEILRRRAAANEAKAAAAKAEALALINTAKALAATDAAKAMLLLDKAEAAAKTAEEAAALAKQEREQAQSVLNQGTGGVSGPIQPSRSVLEDAASTVDRYTASLAQAAELAAAQQEVVQFVQNNYSPEALSVSEVYRQSKNLLSTVEVKMGVNTP